MPIRRISGPRSTASGPTGEDAALRTIQLAIEPHDRKAAYAVRYDVFVTEQQVPAELEVDELDDAADHFVAYDDEEAVGAGRLVVEPLGFEGTDPALGPVGHLGRLQGLRPPESDLPVSRRGVVDALHCHFRDVGNRHVAETDIARAVEARRTGQWIREEHGAQPALHEKSRVENRPSHRAFSKMLLDARLGVRQRVLRNAGSVE